MGKAKEGPRTLFLSPSWVCIFFPKHNVTAEESSLQWDFMAYLQQKEVWDIFLNFEDRCYDTTLICKSKISSLHKQSGCVETLSWKPYLPYEIPAADLGMVEKSPAWHSSIMHRSMLTAKHWDNHGMIPQLFPILVSFTTVDLPVQPNILARVGRKKILLENVCRTPSHQRKSYWHEYSRRQPGG